MSEHGREVRSANTVTRDTPHNRRGEIQHGGPFNPRADSSASQHRSDKAVPVQGSPRRDVIEDRRP